MRQALTRIPLGVMIHNTIPMFRALSVITLGLVSANVYSNEVPTGSIDPYAPELAVAVVRSTGEEIPYDVINGMAILEGDIILGTHDDVQAYGIEALAVAPGPESVCPADLSCSTINASSRRRWPNGIVPFTLSTGTTAASRQEINTAIAEWENKTSVRFVQRTNQRDYIEFVGTGNGNTCSSLLGRSGGRQPINYAGNGAGCLVHEIGHAMGLNHEQNRNDRDDFVNIDFSNVSGNFQSQFRKATTSTDIGPYDFGSVMHYGAFTFALNRSRPVLSAKNANIPLSAIGNNRSTLTPTDVLGIEFVYGDSTPPTPPTPTPPPAPPTPPTNGDAVVAFQSLVDGGTIPSTTRYGEIRVNAFDTDVGTSDGDGIQSVRLVISRNGRVLAIRNELRASYDFGLRLRSGNTYTLTAIAQSTQAAGGTQTSTSVTVTAR